MIVNEERVEQIDIPESSALELPYAVPHHAQLQAGSSASLVSGSLVKIHDQLYVK